MVDMKKKKQLRTIGIIGDTNLGVHAAALVAATQKVNVLHPMGQDTADALHQAEEDYNKEIGIDQLIQEYDGPPPLGNLEEEFIIRNPYPLGPGLPRKGPPVIKSKKIGRNDPCPCGSGIKNKKCCNKTHTDEN